MMEKHGFTLSEIAVVLVVVVLIASGVVVGRSMIDNAEARTLTTEITLYSGAFKEFVDKYQALPGDMPNATTVWGTDTSGSGCTVNGTNSIPKVATCNGNGDGSIGDWRNGAVVTANSEYEWWRAWQQLANAGFIEGKYTGVPASATAANSSIGVNVPRSKVGRGGWTLLYMAVTNGSSEANFFSSAVASHMLVYGAQTTSSFTDTAILTPLQMQSIDEKMDDGKPLLGNVRAKKGAWGSCSDTLTTTAVYQASIATQACQLIYLMGM